MTEPLAASELRMRALSEYIAQSEQSIRDLGLLFVGEQQRLARRLEDRRQRFIAATLARATDRFRQLLLSAPSAGITKRTFYMQAAVAVAREQVLPWLEAEQETVNEEYRRLVGRFSAMTNEFLGRLAVTGVPQLEYTSLEECDKPGSRSHFQFHSLLQIARPASPIRYAADVALTAFGLSRLIRREAEEFLVRLLDVNTSRVQRDLENRLVIARQDMEAAVRHVLVSAKAVASKTLERARETKAIGEPAIQAQIAKLDAVESEIGHARRALFAETEGQSSD